MVNTGLWQKLTSYFLYYRLYLPIIPKYGCLFENVNHHTASKELLIIATNKQIHKSFYFFLPFLALTSSVVSPNTSINAGYSSESTLILTDLYSLSIHTHMFWLFFRSTSPNTCTNSGRRHVPTAISAMERSLPARNGDSFRRTSIFRSNSMISDRAFFSAYESRRIQKSTSWGTCSRVKVPFCNQVRTVAGVSSCS